MATHANSSQTKFKTEVMAARKMACQLGKVCPLFCHGALVYFHFMLMTSLFPLKRAFTFFFIIVKVVEEHFTAGTVTMGYKPEHAKKSSLQSTINL